VTLGAAKSKGAVDAGLAVVDVGERGNRAITTRVIKLKGR